MAQFLVAIHHHTDFDPAAESEQTGRDIDALNEEMIAKGARFFAGGLQPNGTARSIRREPNGEVKVTTGAYLKNSEHVGGFWILNTANLEEAVEWGRKAAIACRAPVEVRPFY